MLSPITSHFPMPAPRSDKAHSETDDGLLRKPINSAMAPNSTAVSRDGKPPSEAQEARTGGDSKAMGMAATVANANIDFSQSNALDLAFKAAIEGINEALAPVMGENAIQAGYESGLDVSPEATAKRIVSMSTGLFGAYKEQNPTLSEDEARQKFSDIISGGIDNGFTEAKNILEGLGALEGNIAENINKTYELVFEGIEAFRQGRTEEVKTEDGSDDAARRTSTSERQDENPAGQYVAISQTGVKKGAVNLSA